jgi:hypothetical protein
MPTNANTGNTKNSKYLKRFIRLGGFLKNLIRIKIIRQHKITNLGISSQRNFGFPEVVNRHAFSLQETIFLWLIKAKKIGIR